ncbi:pentatricopeptide repeat-containing protein At1g71420 isoform X1 [Benincasa hispida]|uniref:pentatricopeptide repeat-containing protein At1g71420 isoform X1 n=1 Tax=Benincasa hispida TaxID=102211 RepID=UPI001902BB33|nr:pentatricopeptide repeat-containing protein At1g71420 isoform X1 [Benincasa hispida]
MKLATIYCPFLAKRNLVSYPSKHAFGLQFRCWRSAAEGDIVHRTEDIDNDYLLESRPISTRGHLRQALSLFYSSRQPHSHQTYANLFHACARLRCLQEGMGLHRYMMSRDDPMNTFDLFVTNHLINMYCKCGHLDYAYQLFNEMPRRNLVSWTVLISGLSQYGLVDECFLIFSRMLVDHRPNEFTVASLLTSFGEHDGERGRQIHGFVLKRSLDVFVYVANALIAMYSKSYSKDGAYNDSKDDAWTMFKSIEKPNLITWNSMIAGFCFRKLGHQAIYLFMQMNHQGIGFDRATLLSTLSSTSLCNWDEFGDGLGFCHQIHCQALKTAFISEVEIITALVKTNAELGGDIADSYRLFVEGGYNRDIVLWTSIMTAFVDHDPGKTLSLFCQFRQEGLTPDGHTFSIVLKACAGFLTEKHASTYHSLLIKSMSEDDTVLNNALIHAYGRCGSISSSKKVFDQMKHHDLVSWNTMMKAYAVHGQAEIALQLFTNMNVPPDATTFVSLLSACSHAGLVEEGISLFNSITDYGIVCQLDHYACMVDILGRSGQIQEAHDFISKMPIEPDFVVWSSFLGSCRKHGATELAKLASYKLKELDPGNSLAYVQMSNLYCFSGSFYEADLIRMEMKGSRVRKEPGLSWVEIENQVHEFASGGCRHPQREVIWNELEELIGRLKEIGYVPETSLALHDVEHEQKEEQLYHHSEKLALVFSVMNDFNLVRADTPIRIMKNIRICVDCHNFMKLASRLLQKEIVIRDSNRFHHFMAGLCSCNDYW